MLRAIVIAALIAALAPGVARGASWRWPVRGRVVGTFLLSPDDPYAAGQRRGIRIAAGPGATVGSACAGRVAFAGGVGRAGPTVSVVCGAWRATYQGLGRLRVSAGDVVVPTRPVGVLGAAGVLRLGARTARPDRTGRPRYVDPLTLLRAAPPIVGPLGRAPRAAPRRTLPPPAIPRQKPAPTPASGPALFAVRVRAPAPARPAPVGAWIGLALLGAALPVGSCWHLRLARDRRRLTLPAAAVGDEMPR
jgi:hypothetical protein